MGLEQELAAFRADFIRTAPQGRVALYEAKIEELRISFARDRAIGVGDEAPGFDLPGINGSRVVLDDLPYETIPVDTSKSEQHLPDFRAINPNGKVPAIVDTDGPGGREARVFDSTAILLYLAEKAGRFLGKPEDRPELLSWLLFIASGLGPFSGQAVHFQFAAPDGLDYAVNRYRREAERHYQVLDEHLAGRSYIVGETYTIADMSAWGWLDRASRVRKGAEDPLAPFPNLKRLFETVDARPAVARARAVGQDHAFKQVRDEEAKRALFPSNYPPAA